MSHGILVENAVSGRVALRRPSHPILGTVVSIPRATLQKCEQCGNVLSKGNEKTRRPASLHVDQENYLQINRHSQFLFQNEDKKVSSKINRRSCFITRDYEEHLYEEVDTESHMQTIDIKLSHKDMKRGVEDFFKTGQISSEDQCDTKHEDMEETSVEVVEKVNIFKMKLLTRISRLMNK